VINCILSISVLQNDVDGMSDSSSDSQQRKLPMGLFFSVGLVGIKLIFVQIINNPYWELLG